MSNRYPILDPSLLPPMKALEPVSTEAILAARMARFKALWTERDPVLGAEYDVDGLEFDPIKINQEANTYFELMLRDRVNQAVRATSLAYATGSDLDGIGSRYPGGVPRLPGESDERYRRRLWLAPSAFSSAGAAGSFSFHALSVMSSLKDVSETVVRPTPREHPTVVLTAMKDGLDPRPSIAELLTIRAHLLSEGIGGLTEVISVRAPAVIPVAYEVDVSVYPGASKDGTLAAVRGALSALAEETDFLGEDQTRNAVGTRARSASIGVQNVKVIQPAADVAIEPTQLGRVPFSIDTNTGARVYAPDVIRVNFAGFAE